MPTRDRSKIKEKVRRLPQGPGVYLMKDRLGRIIYVGKAKNLKKRVSSYFQPSRRQSLQQPKISAMIGLVFDVDVIDVKSEAEALLLEGRLIKEWRPKYNTDFTDDKRFLLIRVDMQSELPRFRLVRFRKDDNQYYFGPFPHSGLLRKTLSEMRRRFGILLSDAQPKRLSGGHWRLYDDIRSEIFGHPNCVTRSEYLARVDEACVFLEGKSNEWLAELKEEMATAADGRQYEKAAELRDIVQALEATLLKTRKFSRAPDVRARVESALHRLREHLALPALPNHIECFDISHISGTFCVASMVHFAMGKPKKNQYRRFKIRSFIGNDDYRAMEEIVARRYMRLSKEQRPFPDLVVIDGGMGQLGAALRAFLSQNLEPPPLIGLAKKNETIVFTDDRKPLNLPLRDNGLQLLQRLRDEAHRFANTYNADLRSRRIKETILDDFPGLGPVRRQALLQHFGTIERLRKANDKELREVPGVGPGLAHQLALLLQPEFEGKENRD